MAEFDDIGEFEVVTEGTGSSGSGHRPHQSRPGDSGGGGDGDGTSDGEGDDDGQGNNGGGEQQQPGGGKESGKQDGDEGSGQSQQPDDKSGKEGGESNPDDKGAGGNEPGEKPGSDGGGGKEDGTDKQDGQGNGQQPSDSSSETPSDQPGSDGEGQQQGEEPSEDDGDGGNNYDEKDNLVGKTAVVIKKGDYKAQYGQITEKEEDRLYKIIFAFDRDHPAKSFVRNEFVVTGDKVKYKLSGKEYIGTILNLEPASDRAVIKEDGGGIDHIAFKNIIDLIQDESSKEKIRIQSQSLEILALLIGGKRPDLSEIIYNYPFFTFSANIQEAIITIVNLVEIREDKYIIPKQYEKYKELDKVTAKAMLIFLRNHSDFYKEGKGLYKYLYFFLNQMKFIWPDRQSVMQYQDAGISNKWITYYIENNELQFVLITKQSAGNTEAHCIRFDIDHGLKEANAMIVSQDVFWTDTNSVLAELNNYKKLPLKAEENQVMFISASDHLFPIFKNFVSFVEYAL